MEGGPPRAHRVRLQRRPGRVEQEAASRAARGQDGDRLLEKSDGLLRQTVTVAVRYAFIHREEGHYPIAMMCRALKVSRSGYYAWLSREPSKSAQRRKELEALIEWLFNDSHGTYGYRRIHAALARRGVRACPDTVRLLMGALGLEAVQPRARRRTTIPASGRQERAEAVGRDFTAEAPDMKWVGDITYIHTWEGFVYLATVLDCCTKKAVGYALADHMKTSLVCDAIDMAVRNCPPKRGATVFHSDRGCQYLCEKFSQRLAARGILASTGRTGVCWDNSWAESFNATLKNERVYQMVYPTRAKAIRDIASWIELEYNHKRLRSSLGYRTPAEAEEAHRSTTQTA
ncbi:IS3 family transposase [Actinomyces bowdenii]|uniref:IS3 family transposase n=1 Tax=Actinomyces bowdenii TaxID=131109 RepID=UPI0035A363FC